MELAIAVVVGCLVVAFLIRWVTGRAADAIVNNTVGKKSAKAGAAITSSDLVITTQAEPGVVLNALRQHVQADQVAPAVASSLYVSGVSDSAIQYSYGNKIGTSFVAIVSAQPDGAGSAVRVTVTKWTNAGMTKAGMTVQDGNRMERLRSEVTAAVRAVDPAATPQVVGR